MHTPYRFGKPFNFQALKTIGEKEAMVTEESICTRIQSIAMRCPYWSNAKIWISELIAQAYGFDAPWCWHLQRIVSDEAMKPGFADIVWTKTFIDSYIAAINTAEAQLVADTGMSLALHA